LIPSRLATNARRRIIDAWHPGQSNGIPRLSHQAGRAEIERGFLPFEHDDAFSLWSVETSAVDFAKTWHELCMNHTLAE
jgi:hypothetical protein